MNFDFNTVVERRETVGLKWDKYRGTDIIPMWLADMIHDKVRLES